MSLFKTKLDPKKFGITLLLSLVAATIFSTLVSTYFTTIPILKSGPAFFLILISVFIIYFFVAVSDGKIDKNEILTMIIIAVALVISGWTIKEFLPQIFSAFPQATKDLFSAFGI